MSTTILTMQPYFSEDHLVAAMGALSHEAQRCRREADLALEHEANGAAFMFGLANEQTWIDRAVFWARHVQQCEEAHALISACKRSGVELDVTAHELATQVLLTDLVRRAVR